VRARRRAIGIKGTVQVEVAFRRRRLRPVASTTDNGTFGVRAMFATVAALRFNWEET
jgi:hypothetical protein